MLELSAVIDAMCDQINTRNPKFPGVDIVMHGVTAIENTLCSMFSIDGNKMTAEFLNGDMLIFCWAPTEEAHKRWVTGH